MAEPASQEMLADLPGPAEVFDGSQRSDTRVEEQQQMHHEDIIKGEPAVVIWNDKLLR